MCEPTKTKGTKGQLAYLRQAVLATLSCSSQDTASGHLCDLSLTNAMTVLLPDHRIWLDLSKNTNPAKDLLECYPPDFANTLIIFALSMTDSKLRRFKQLVSTCHCSSLQFPSSDDGSMEMIRDLHFQATPDGFVSRVCRKLYLLMGILLRIPGIGNPLDPTDHTSPVQHPTPANVAEGVRYMRGKAADVILASRCWFKQSKCPFVPFLLIVCARRYPREFLPVLRSAGGQDISAMVIKELRVIATSVQQSTPAMEPITANALMFYLHYIRDLSHHFRLQSLRTIRPLIETIYESAVILFNAFKKFKQPEQQMLFKHDIHSALSYVAMVAAPDDFSPDQSVDVAHYFYHSGELGNTVKNGMGMMFDLWAQDQLVYSKVWADLSLLTPVQECMNPLCGKLQDRHQFPKCSRCQTTRYCSTDCQKRAWTLPECPHKQVCKIWSRLIACWPLLGEFLDLYSDINPADREKLLRNYAAPLEIPDSKMLEIVENVKVLQSMRSKRATESGDREGARLLMDCFLP